MAKNEFVNAQITANVTLNEKDTQICLNILHRTHGANILSGDVRTDDEYPVEVY